MDLRRVRCLEGEPVYGGFHLRQGSVPLVEVENHGISHMVELGIEDDNENPEAGGVDVEGDNGSSMVTENVFGHVQAGSELTLRLDPLLGFRWINEGHIEIHLLQ